MRVPLPYSTERFPRAQPVNTIHPSIEPSANQREVGGGTYMPRTNNKRTREYPPYLSPHPSVHCATGEAVMVVKVCRGKSVAESLMPQTLRLTPSKSEPKRRVETKQT